MPDAALETIDAFIATQGVDTSEAGWRTHLVAPPEVAFDASSSYLWDLETNVGNIAIQLQAADAPAHVASTIYLTRMGFYDGLKFHRVITQFMAQGGCPLGSGTGGPGYEYAGEFGGNRKHDQPGLLSMANAGPGTDGSQFFLTFVPTPWLDGKHTIFGEVIDGMETVKALEARGSESGRASEPLSITKATIRVE